MKKRILTLALALTMCLGLAAPAFAAEGKTVTTPDGKYTITNVLGEATLKAAGEDAKDLDGVTVYLVPATGATVTPVGVTEEDSVWNTVYHVKDGVLTHEDGGVGMWDPEWFQKAELWEERRDVEEAYFQDGIGDLYGMGLDEDKGVYVSFVKDGASVPEDKDPEPSEPAAPEFTDVPEGAYFEAPVAWAVEKKITNGTEPTKFSPEDTCTQLQILTFLYRAVQSAEDPDFVPAGTDMISAGVWAEEKGMTGDNFDGNAPCTRADAVNYIWQTFDKPEADKSEFKDVDAEAIYAAAVDWAVANGVTNGTDMEAGEFSPDDTCTRGQIVTFLHRAYVEEARLTVAE